MTLKWLLVPLGGLLILSGVIFFSLGLFRKPGFIHNFEEGEYSQDQPFVEPHSVSDGLAVYFVGSGEPVLLFPYPHGHTTAPMAEGPLAENLLGLGRTVITFDVPGAYRSTRPPAVDMDEMINCANETLDRLGIEGPVDVVGHSMGGLAALAFSIEHPERTNRLVLIGTFSGLPSAIRWGMPGSSWNVFEAEYWNFMIWGLRVVSGRGDLALHKKLQNIMEAASYQNKRLFTPVEIEGDDYKKGIPIRMIWTKKIRGLTYANRFELVQSPTMVLVGRHDPEGPLSCSEELFEGISHARLVIFERSGHYPFVEENSLFTEALDVFLHGEEKT
ncbi:MAG: alpha/beta hydrolase [Anaerolineales bacterium]|nr:alpha/beta hydrolase [Anaerolineales bacterium]